MARKAKEEVLKTKKTTKTTKPESKKSASKTAVSKSTSAKKTTSKTVATKSASAKKATSKTATAKSASAKKATSKTSTAKSASAKKTTSKTVATKSASAKKATSKTATAKSASAKKTTSKTATTKSASTKKATKKVTKVKKVSSKKTPVKQNNVPEYYDLPYRYNQTIVKVLAQNPNTLFVYWDISDEDIENFEKQYGNDFFSKTKPVLVIHNLTDNYAFEINDFANNWYVNVNDTKCKYFVELGRRSKDNDFINTPVNYLNIAFSNTIDIPNDHILFFKENDKIYFKNIKTNKITEKAINSFKHSLQGIYKTYNLSSEENDRFDRFDFNNPSSQNPTSTLL